MVFSEKAFARETKTLEKKIKKEKEQVEKEVWHLSNQEFYSEEDALKAAREREKRWKYHEISATAMETKRKRKRENGGWGDQEKTSLHRRSTAMERRTYTEIERALKHSLTAIKRYILTFFRVAYLTEKGIHNKRNRFSRPGLRAIDTGLPGVIPQIQR